MNPRFPVYIISKGRWESRMTSKALEQRNIPYQIVVEPQEYANYAAVIDPGKILTLPFSNLGQGSIPARNWVWEHSIARGATRHWILDDNVADFYRLNNNIKSRTTSGTTFFVIEEFVERYANVALAGMQYEMFVPRINKTSPFTLNSRIYSIILIQNNIPYRWRGRYNEDTDLSLRALKEGWCTVLFKAFLGKKVGTMKMKGGNTESLYQGDGRRMMAESLKEQHPDVTTIVWKWGRWQHKVNYRPFRGNRFRLKEGVVIPEGMDNYGMVEKFTPAKRPG